MPYADAATRRTARRRSYQKRKGRILAQERQYRAMTPARFASAKLKCRYGITLQDYERMYVAQSGLCACCGLKPPVDVDHCHVTGAVRGLLCRACNLGLGMFGDNLSGLEKAINYLKGE